MADKYISRHTGQVIDDGIVKTINPENLPSDAPVMDSVEMGDGSKYKVGGGDPSAAKLKKGYYYNGQFYEDAAHTTPIAGDVKNLYVDLETSLIYTYNGTTFVSSAVKYQAGSGIIINGVTITYDPDVLAAVNYVDGSITDTLFYVDQQDNNEHAGRVVGDNLLSNRIDGLNTKIEGRMALAVENAKYQWDGDQTDRAKITCTHTPKVSRLCWVSNDITLSGKFFNSVMVTKVTKDASGQVIGTETKPGAEYMENGTDISDPTTGTPIGCVVGGDSRYIFISLPAGTFTLDGGNIVVPQSGTYLMYDEGADYYIYFSKIDDGSSTPSYIEQDGQDITQATADVLRPDLAIPEVVVNSPSTTTAKMTKFQLNGVNYSIAGTGALVFNNIQAFVTEFNSKAKEDAEVGTLALIRTVEVPDLWISANNESTSTAYTYTTDEQFVTDLKAAAQTGLKVGYYRVNQFEGDKVYIPVEDVQINGTTIVAGGVAIVPIGSSSQLGVFQTSGSYGIKASPAGVLQIEAASDSGISAKSSGFFPIVPSKLDKAVMEGLNPASSFTGWTDEKKAGARETIGAIGDVQIDGTTIVSGGIANVPLASSTVAGVSKGTATYGITYDSRAYAVINKAADSEITGKTSQYKPIVPNNLDKAVMEGLGNNSLNWSDAYKASARETIGAAEDVIEAGTGENSIQQKGTLSEATGDNSSAFGMNTHAGATGSHSEGGLTATRNDYDEATETGFDAAYSHVEGLNNATNNVAEHGEGKYGWSYYDDAHDPAKSSIHYVGIGTNNQDTYRKNAEVIMNNGDKYILGVGGYDGKNIENASTLQETLESKNIEIEVW